MPPRRASAKRKKSSSTNASTPSTDHELPTPEVVMGAESADDVKVEETETEVLSLVEGSDPNPAEIDAVVISSESMIKEEVISENCAVEDVNDASNENGEPEFGDDEVKVDLPLASEDVDEEKQVGAVMKEVGVVCLENDEPEEIVDKEKDDLQESENVDEEKQGEELEKEDDGGVSIDGSQLETVAEIISAQEETTAVQVDDFKIQNDNNNPQDDSKELGDSSLNVHDSPSDKKKDKEIEIYVGKLDKNAVEDDLVNVFQRFGELKSTRIVRNLSTKKSKGYAFVQFASVDQAKRALFELKDGVEVRGKRVTISASLDNDTLFLGNISKTWKKEEVLQQLKDYGIENIERIEIPENSKITGKIRGFAFLEFTTHSDAVAAFQRLRKPDAVFGRNISAKVSFAQTRIQSNDEDLSQVNRVYVEGLPKDWNEEKFKEICKKYGEIVKVNLCSRSKNKIFGFVSFTSSESALACVEGINNTDIGGETKIKASIAKSQQKSRFEKQSEASTMKDGEISNKNSKPKLSKMKGVLNPQQTKRNQKDSSKQKIKSNTVKPQQKGPVNGESSKKPELSKIKGELISKQAKGKRKASFEQKVNDRDQGIPKKQKNVGEGQNSKITSKAGNNKRKNASMYEGREERGNRNAQGKKPFKKQKGNMHRRERYNGTERDNSRNPKTDTRIIRGHDDYRNSTRYIDPYAPSYAASNAYHLAPDNSLSTRRYNEMEAHAGYIKPAEESRSYSRYIQPTAHSQRQTVYLELSSTSQSQSQNQHYSRYFDPSIMTQSRTGYMDTVALPEVQSYREYRPSAILQTAHDPYDSRISRAVRHDDRGAGLISYVGGPSRPASQVPDHTSYYQGEGSYSGAYSTRRTYY